MKRLLNKFKNSEANNRETPSQHMPARRNINQDTVRFISYVPLSENHPPHIHRPPSASSAASQNGVGGTSAPSMASKSGASSATTSNGARSTAAPYVAPKSGASNATTHSGATHTAPKSPLKPKQSPARPPAPKLPHAGRTSGNTSSVHPPLLASARTVLPSAPPLTPTAPPSATLLRNWFNQNSVPESKNKKQMEPEKNIPKPEVTSPHHGLEEEMLQELTCSVCMEIYTDPLLFPCLHSLCSSCVKNLKDTFNVIKCPDCRRVVSDHETKRNFPLKNLVEIFRREFRSRQSVQNTDDNQHLNDTLRRIQKQSTKTPRPKCPCCDVTPRRFATVRCLQCKMMFCDNCLVIFHPTVVTTADHTLEQVAARQQGEHRARNAQAVDNSETDLQFQQQVEMVIQSMEHVRQQLRQTSGT